MIETRKRKVTGILVGLCVSLCGLAQEPATPIAGGETLFVEVSRHPDLSVTARVDANGDIVLPFNVGVVHVAGMTEGEASGVVSKAYLKLLRNPRATVSRTTMTTGGVSRTAEMKTEIIELKNADAQTLCESLQGITTGGGSVSFDPDTNALIVTDTPGALTNIMSVVARLDGMQDQITQVRIEAKLAEVQAGAMKELGIRWFVQGKNPMGGYYPMPNQDVGINTLKGDSADPFNNEAIGSTGFQNSLQQGFIGRQFVGAGQFDRRLNVPVMVPKVGQMFFGLHNGTLDLGSLLDALVADNRAEMLANPNILTVNHKMAEIKMTKEFPYTEYGTQGLQTSYSTRFMDLGIKLTVTPHVYEDETGKYVKLELAPEVSYPHGSNNGIPIREVRSSKTVAKVRDGQTLVVGGIYSDETRNVEQRVPGLGKLPLIGRLFKRTEKNKAKTEMMVFVTPTIHETPESVTWDKMLDLTSAAPSVPAAPAAASREGRSEGHRE